MQGGTSITRHRPHRYRNSESDSRLPWASVLELNSQRAVTSGSNHALCAAIRRGADLRIHTDFVFNEHIDLNSNNAELVHEVSDFRVTYLVEDRWAAGIMSLRMSLAPPDGLGPQARMSFFLYNQDGQQAVAKPSFEGRLGTGQLGPSPAQDHLDMLKYHQQDCWDAGTNAPSSNFIYDFNCYRYMVCDDWQEVFSHTAEGDVISGSLDPLNEALIQGREIKVGIRGLCRDLFDATKSIPDHTVFVHTGSGYYFTERKLFCAGTQPVVRVKPGIPMRYMSGCWDFGWLLVRTDGFVDCWLCDPYTFRFHKKPGRYAIRWFVR